MPASDKSLYTGGILHLAESLGDALERLRKIESDLRAQVEPINAAKQAQDYNLKALEAALLGIRAMDFNVLKADLEKAVLELNAKIDARAQEIQAAKGELSGEQARADKLRADLEARAFADLREIKASLASLSALEKKTAQRAELNEAQLDEFLRLSSGKAVELGRNIALLSAEFDKRTKELAAQVETAAASLNAKSTFTPKGVYEPGASYDRGDVVTLNGSSYVSLVDGNTEKPSRKSAKWQTLAQRGGVIAGGVAEAGGDSLPPQAGNSRKFLTTDGAVLSWATLTGGGDMLGANNLSDVANAVTAFTNIKQAATESASGVVELATSVETDAGKVVQASDTRLSDDRDPTAHKTSHENGGADEISVAGLSGELADAQTPKTHATSHKSGGSDAIKLDELAAPTDVTTLDASTSAHGLLVKATAPASGLVNVVGIANGETAYTNKALFDTTNPAALGSVGPGTATVAARRDHVHAMPSAADVSALPTAGGTMSGSITLGENTGVALDPAGSADGKWSGITVTGTSGYSQAFGDLVTLDKDDSRWEAVDISVAAAATGDARGIMGIVVSAGTDGNACTILLHGIVRADANFPTLTIGAPVYASTSGDVVVAQPSTTDYVIRVVGHGLTAEELYFNPDNAYITHT